MNLLTALAGSIGLIAIIYVILILAELSQRLGAVTKMQRYYRVFYIGVIFLLISLTSRILRISVFLSPQQNPVFLNDDLFYLLTYHVPLAIGTTINLAITLLYWGWLLKER